MEIKNVALNESLTNDEIKECILKSIEGKSLKKVLLLPPDHTRLHSQASIIVKMYYELLKDTCIVDIMPCLGTHNEMNDEELDLMYPGVPHELFIYHNFRTDCSEVGTVPASFIKEVTEGLWSEDVPVLVNRRLLDPSYDLIISIGQVVPHEVIGMSNHAKNIFVGCGGAHFINLTHMIGATYGMERMMGKDYTPVRKILDYALENFLNKIPLIFVLTVTSLDHEKNVINTHGLFIGDTRNSLTDAVKLSQEKNIIFIPHGLKKVIVYLDPKEFKSTWLGNKSVYRTRMAIADNGELIVLAPGVNKFGEDKEIDRLIRKYGYKGRINTLEKFKENEDLRLNMSAAAHLIHGSSDGRFSISYSIPNMTKEEVESVGYKYLDYNETIKKYHFDELKDGMNVVDGEEIFYISNPALGLWINKEKF